MFNIRLTEVEFYDRKIFHQLSYNVKRIPHTER
jgi:hypothetical protein